MDPWSHPQDLQSLPSFIRRVREGTSPNAPQGVWVMNPHHYANPLDQKTALAATTSTKILDRSDTFRNYLLIRNPDSTALIYISFDQPASADSALVLLPGTSSGELALFDTVVPQGDIYAYATGACNVVFSFSTFKGF